LACEKFVGIGNYLKIGMAVVARGDLLPMTEYYDYKIFATQIIMPVFYP